MIKRSREQWLSLFEGQAKSGLNQARFCKERGLCPKYFSVRRRQLTGGAGQGKFVRVRRSIPTPLPSAVEWQLQVGEVKVRVLNVPLDQMLGLLKGLA